MTPSGSTRRRSGRGDVWQSAFGDIEVDALYDAIDSEATT